jgi:hypothetical protein
MSFLGGKYENGRKKGENIKEKRRKNKEERGLKKGKWEIKGENKCKIGES